MITELTAFILAGFPYFYLNLVGAITPGPNNVMLTASGMNFGYKKTIPHMAGIYVAFTFLLLLSAFGVGTAVSAFPPFLYAIKALGSGYLVYLAWKIYNAGRLGLAKKAEETTRPMTFLEAAAFQFVNPKGLVFALTTAGLLPGASTLQIVMTVLVSSLISCGISLNAWTLFGTAVATLFRDDKARRIINTALALLLLATLPLMVL